MSFAPPPFDTRAYWGRNGSVASSEIRFPLTPELASIAREANRVVPFDSELSGGLTHRQS